MGNKDQDRYSQSLLLYGEIKDSKSLLTNLFNIIDIKQFGVAFALKNWNISINGAVQIGQGLNKLDKNYTIEQEILSPFASSNEKTQSTTGIQIIVEHCCYMYPFIIPTASKYESFKFFPFINLIAISI